mmetsp:Transcript_1320/g.3331  ORF Transcript_1320/g.3331 Transcript_1320/m.3331 type:complete len:267 (+) Transcript_1320:2-802(+)
MRPYLARPWINAFKPLDFSAPWWAPAQRQLAENVFRGAVGAHPVIVIQTLGRMPEMGIPQVCVIGHSNVGKSSLINALVFGREIARPSKEPGRTRHLFVFDLDRRLSLVDLPGYGHAKVSADLQQDWHQLVSAYLRRSDSLRRVVCLVDASRGISRQDTAMWDKVQGAGRMLMVVLTKVDLCHPEDLHRNVAEVIAALQPLDKSLVWPYIHAVSSDQELGLRELRASLSVESLGSKLGGGSPGDGQGRRRRRAAGAADGDSLMRTP